MPTEPVVTSDHLPVVPDHFGVVFPDGAVMDCNAGALLFGQEAEERARRIAANVQGRPVRIVTTLVPL